MIKRQYTEIIPHSLESLVYAIAQRDAKKQVAGTPCSSSLDDQETVTADSEQCAWCNGTGRIAVGYPEENLPRVRCSACRGGGLVPKLDGNGPESCHECGGTGERSGRLNAEMTSPRK